MPRKRDGFLLLGDVAEAVTLPCDRALTTRAGGSAVRVPAHHRAAEALDDYLEAAGLDEAKAPLLQSVDPSGWWLTGRALSRRLVLAMIKRRAAAAGLPASTCCHTFRATGITAYLSNGGTLEHAQRIAGHASPKTTKLYDRTADTISVEQIGLATWNGKCQGIQWRLNGKVPTGDELAGLRTCSNSIGTMMRHRSRCCRTAKCVVPHYLSCRVGDVVARVQ